MTDLFDLTEKQKVESPDAAVDGMLLPDPKTFSHTYRAGDMVTQIPTYVVPIAFSSNHQMHGLFVVDNEVRRARIGFHRVGVHDSYHIPQIGAPIADETQQKNRLYLPLRRLDVLRDVQGRSGKNFNNSPFFLYGLMGAENDTYPVVFVAPNGRSKIQGMLLYEDSRSGYLNVVRGTDLPFDRRALEEVVQNAATKTTIHLSPAARRRVKKSEPERDVNLENPRDVIAYLGDSVVSQDGGLEDIGLNVATHVLRSRTDGESGVPSNNNLLIIGPTGCGKSFSIRDILGSALRKNGMPFVSGFLSGKVPEGFDGPTMSCLYKSLATQMASDPDKYGVMFLDEIDKLVDGANDGGKTSFSGPVIADLITQVESGMVYLGQNNHLDLSNVMFIAAGAFSGRDSGGLAKIAAKRLGLQRRCGFIKESKQPDETTSLSNVTIDDLVEYGVPRELATRFSTLVVYNPLSVDDKIGILRHGHQSPLTAQVNLLTRLYESFEVTVEPGVADEIAAKSLPQNGARDLRGLTKIAFREILLNPEEFAHGNEIVVARDYVKDALASVGTKTVAPGFTTPTRVKGPQRVITEVASSKST